MLSSLSLKLLMLNVNFFPAGTCCGGILLGYRHISAEEWCTEQHCWFALLGTPGSTEERQIFHLVTLMLTFCSEIMKVYSLKEFSS